MSIKIRPFLPKDAPLVASLHRLAIPRGFLSELGDGFLGQLYTLIACSSGACVLVAVDSKDRCQGFIAGSIDLRNCYREVLRRGALPLFWKVLPNLFRPSVLMRIVQTILYPLRKTKGEACPENKGDVKDSTKAELLSIAVDEKTRGSGVGRLLIDALEEYFRRNGHPDSYHVVTDAQDPRSNAFYASMGFQHQRAFKHHDHDMNQYVKEVPDMIADSARG